MVAPVPSRVFLHEVEKITNTNWEVVFILRFKVEHSCVGWGGEGGWGSRHEREREREREREKEREREGGRERRGEELS